MHPDELTDRRLDETLRRQPRWTPPRHFVHAVVARMPAATEAGPWLEAPRGSGIVQAITTGILGAGVAYLGGAAILHAMPVLVMNAEIVGWIGAAAALLVAAAVNGFAEEWI